MNQHDQGGMQSWKLKDIGKDLENSSSKELLCCSSWNYKKKTSLYSVNSINCPHQRPTQTESGTQRGKESWT